MKLHPVSGLLVFLAGCSLSGPSPERAQSAKLQAALEEIERLQSLVAKERAIRAINEIDHTGKVSGESKRLMDALLASKNLVDQAQGGAVLGFAVRKDPSYYPIALKRVRELQTEGDPDYWKGFEATLIQEAQAAKQTR